jgi:hypothetical protein
MTVPVAKPGAGSYGGEELEFTNADCDGVIDPAGAAATAVQPSSETASKADNKPNRFTVRNGVA